MTDADMMADIAKELWRANEELRALEARGNRTLRDYFAAAALTGLLAQCGSEDAWPSPQQIKSAAGYAYQAADAMLKAREGKS